ncbi:unnamed protein product [Gordionus sp. m RMFG-2023]
MIAKLTENIFFIYEVYNGSLNRSTFLDKKFLNVSLNCTSWKTHHVPRLYIRIVFNLVIWTIGIIGNSIGLYAAWEDRSKYIRVSLMKAYYAINLINLCFMYLYPLLDGLAEYCLWKFWNRYTWKYYLSTLHFPLAKTFLNLSFSICVIFAFAQIIAISYPIYYREHFTTRKIKLMILGCFIYLLIWFLPSAWWFHVIKIVNICDPFFLLYSWKLVTFKTLREKNAWITYGLFREFMTKFLPLAIISIFNIWSLKRKKEFLKCKPDLKLTDGIEGITEIPNLLVNDEMVEKTASSTSKVQIAVINIADGIGNGIQRSISLHCDSPTNTTQLINIQELKIKLKLKEYKINKRMLLINMLEYLIFLFPVPLYMILVDFLESHTISDHQEFVFSICTLVEYMYVSFTFYVNFLFNPGYREEVVKILRKSQNRYEEKWNL